MNEKKYFFQDFLLENMPVDERDYPDVEIEICKNNDFDPDSNTIISFDRMLRMNKYDEWNSLFMKIKNKKVIIVDDVPITNSEVKSLKDFYLGVYYYKLSQHSMKCQVFKNNC